jgi:hypothetical protein
MYPAMVLPTKQLEMKIVVVYAMRVSALFSNGGQFE